jgi:prepilin-type processing-associated H-X9-DG protein
VFARARENARRASCSSNLKQMGLGIMQYNQDYDEKYPFARWKDGPHKNWGQAIYPYVKSQQVFACPSNTDNTKVMGWRDQTPGVPQIPTSYAINFEMSDRDWVPSGLSMAALQEASRKIMVGERRGDDTEPGIMWDDWEGNQWQDVGFSGHLQTANYLFCDGHVKAMRPTATVAGNYSMWGKWRSTTCTENPAINCNDVSPAAVNALKLLEQKYQ